MQISKLTINLKKYLPFIYICLTWLMIGYLLPLIFKMGTVYGTLIRAISELACKL